MNKLYMRNACLMVSLVAMFLGVMAATSHAVVDGIYVSGANPSFNLYATGGQIQMGDGSVAYMWGYANGPAGVMQYPGPTIIVDQGATVTVTLTNAIAPISPNPAMNVSIVFPGQTVTAIGGTPGILTQEAQHNKSVVYKFIASSPGTYTYYSGTRPDLQVEMGLIGTLIVQPTLGGANCSGLPPDPNGIRPSRGFAYCSQDAYFDREYLFHVSEIDPAIHALVENGMMAQVNMTKRHATAFFVNGRNLPDTMEDAFVPWMPNQPYNAMPMMHPGEKVLIRWVGGGTMLHPYHTHGQNHSVIARDGRLLTSNPAAASSADLQLSDFTTTNVPGETVDAIWGPWTAAKLSWDIYGHTGNEPGICTAATTDPVTHLDINTYEYCPDHGKPIPLNLPAESLLEFGAMYGGSPFIGDFEKLPDIFVRQNLMAGQSFMWHSHNEKELTTNNIFIGGMGTMALVLPYTDIIP